MVRFGRAVLGVMLVLVVAPAWGQTFYLHNSGPGVPVPGDPAAHFFLDQTGPVGGTAVVEQIMVGRGLRASFPIFTSQAFGVATMVDPAVVGTLYLRANQAMNGCATVSVTAYHVLSSGGRIPLDTVSEDTPIAQTVGPVQVDLCGSPGAAELIPAGDGVAVEVTITNLCRTNRSVQLHYDATVAPSQLGLVPAAPCTPFGGDDSGCLTLCLAASRCEQRVANTVGGTLVSGIVKCHIKAADAAFKLKPFDEEACEDATTQKFLAKSRVEDCPCVDPAGIATNWESILDATNLLLYCDSGGAAFLGDDSGFVPTTKDILRCEDGMAKCLPALAKGILKCHAKAAAAYVKGTLFDEEACEEAPVKGVIPKWDACIAKAQARGGCAGCEQPAALFSIAETILEGGNDQIFCTY